MPAYEVYESDGIGTSDAYAKGRITQEEAVAHCLNWRPGADLDECASQLVDDEDVAEISADCASGILTSSTGDTYTYDGIYTAYENPDWAGRPRFKDVSGEVVGTSYAEGGITLGTQWDLLCHGMPLDDLPIGALLPPEQLSSEPEVVMHNGSYMYLDYGTGTITYSSPREGLEGIVEEGTVLFRGRIIPNRWLEGVAFTFKPGCEPAPYPVTGSYDGLKLVLTGAAPVREGCDVVDYDPEAANARLEFQLNPG